jgi:hypothetical protein
MNNVKRSITAILVMMMFVSLAPTEVHGAGLEYIDLSTWEQKGDISSGIWVIEEGNRTVIQTVNRYSTFYVSPNNVIDQVVQGTICVKDLDTWKDDDFIGFVFGFKDIDGVSPQAYDFYLFDWKKKTQSTSNGTAYEGYRLMRVQGTAEGDSLWDNIGGGITVIQEKIDSDGTNEYNWQFDTEYSFKLIYGTNRIKILIDDEVIFDVEGDFQEGKFGFYNYSQSYVQYGNIQQAPASFDAAAPVATDDSYGMDKGAILTRTRFEGILANDYDPNLDTYTVELLDTTSPGSLNLDLTDGSFTYTPPTDFEGIDTFTYQLKDSTDLFSRVATASISVQEPNVAPTDMTITNNNVSIGASDHDTVGYLSTVDGNLNDSFDYLLLDSVDGCFGISGNELYVNDASKLIRGTMNVEVKTVDLRDLEYTETLLMNIIDDVSPSAPSISSSPSAITTGSASVTIISGTDNESGVDKTQYKIDEEEWQDYSEAMAFSSEGAFVIMAKTIDNAGNATTSDAFTLRIDRTSPVITINGDNPYRIGKGESYTDQGASAHDENSGVNGTIGVENNVDTTSIGAFNVTYTARDNAGNEVEAVRTVRVVENMSINFRGFGGIGRRSASVNGTIENIESSSDLIRYGFVWSGGNIEPTILDSVCDSEGLTDAGDFTGSIGGLSSNSRYYIRAFAEDSSGIVYSETSAFKTDKKPVTSITTVARPETTEPEISEEGNEVYDFTKRTSVPEVIGTVDGAWVMEQVDEPLDTLLGFGSYSHSIILSVSELIPDGGEEADSEDVGGETPAALKSCKITVREEKNVKANWLISDVPDEQKKERNVVSPVVTYEVTATMSDRSREEIKRFDSYVERRLTVGKKENLDISNLVAVRFDDVTGEFVPVPASFEEDSDGALVAVISDNQTGSYAVVENNRNYALELSEKHWAAETAAKMSKKLMLEEVFDEGMDLDTGITRAEMSGVLLKALGINKNSASSDKTFDDLKEGSKWHNTVIAATEAGILKGYGDGTVKPDKVISREEMAAVIYRTMDCMIEMVEARDKVIYEDHGAIKAWAVGQVNALTDIAVFKGYESGKFIPDGDIKVGEALTALYRMSKYLNFID